MNANAKGKKRGRGREGEMNSNRKIERKEETGYEVSFIREDPP